jgi:RHS repeat-associated protein
MMQVSTASAGSTATPRTLAQANWPTFTDYLNPASFTDSSTSNTYSYDNTTYRLASVTGTAASGFTYNYAGDVSSKTANGSTYTHQYDLFRNLTGISQSPGGNLATFSYDGDGKRISKLAGGVRTIYHYDKEGRLLSESDANGNAICDYIYLGTNLVGKMYEPASSGIYYYHTDPAGTPLAVTNTSGAVVWKGYYEPFGNEYAIQGTIGNDVRFAGNKKDDETGLNYFGARYMDSALGRFHAPDPVGPVDSKTGKINDKILTEPQRLNAYAYALNGPGRYVDREGQNPVLIAAAVLTAYYLLTNPDAANAPDNSHQGQQLAGSSGASGIIKDGVLDVAALGVLKILSSAKLLSILADNTGAIGSIFTRKMLSTSEVIAEGSKIEKVAELVEEFGGKARDWVKKKGFDAMGNEWHWYENQGRRVGVKPAGEPDPF